jgi:hypothetical protein
MVRGYPVIIIACHACYTLLSYSHTWIYHYALQVLLPTHPHLPSTTSVIQPVIHAIMHSYFHIRICRYHLKIHHNNNIHTVRYTDEHKWYQPVTKYPLTHTLQLLLRSYMTDKQTTLRHPRKLVPQTHSLGYKQMWVGGHCEWLGVTLLSSSRVMHAILYSHTHTHGSTTMRYKYYYRHILTYQARLQSSSQSSMQLCIHIFIFGYADTTWIYITTTTTTTTYTLLGTHTNTNDTSQSQNIH